jgi:hypothetical protein
MLQLQLQPKLLLTAKRKLKKHCWQYNDRTHHPCSEGDRMQQSLQQFCPLLLVMAAAG